jgi:hypothetical protein
LDQLSTLVFEHAARQLQAVMALVGEPTDRMEEAVRLLGEFQRLTGAMYRKPAVLAAAMRWAVAQRDHREDLSLKMLSNQHAGARGHSIARLARTMSADIHLFPPERSIVAKPVQPKQSTEERMLSMLRRARELEAERSRQVTPLHEREPFKGDPSLLTFTFRVKLAWSLKVWRDLELRGDQTLFDLHGAIQQAFGWDDDHLWVFHLSPAKGKRYDDHGSNYGPGDDDMPAETELAQFNFQLRRKFNYLFDFGDSLLHHIEVIAVDKPAPRAKYPRLVDKHGKAPPQYGSDEFD